MKEAIKKAIGDDIATLNQEIKHFQGMQKSARNGGQPSASEARATEADQHQARPLELTAEEEAQLDANLRTLAIALRRDGETDEQAYERVKASQYLIEFKHDEYWPFYHVEHRFGRVILTINTAHPFFEHLYEPLRKMGAVGEPVEAEIKSAMTEAEPEPPPSASNPSIAGLDPMRKGRLAWV